MVRRRCREVCAFQLHHTGIKTQVGGHKSAGKRQFQLHHTGIKTGILRGYVSPVLYFNCTIQELKPNISC